ncbi:MAG: putative dipeptidase PepE [Candidatus Dichloromethanomonas elyunquensis]|nr:MAG: putative dipeptidase PepE [Candidatus Dichloromethanomonas elyunquensis]
MTQQIAKNELEERRSKFYAAMTEAYPDWDTAMILSKVNQYYFTGTMQDGLLMIKKDRQVFYFVRRSFERAQDESPLSNIYTMESYRDAAILAGPDCGYTFLETEIVTLGLIDRLQKHFNIEKIDSLDKIILSIRAVKSPYELECLETSGKIHDRILMETVPKLLKEGISEADFTAELFGEMVKQGHQGLSRFAMFQSEIVVGQIGFGENSLYPTCFDGPGGARGLYPAVPLLGSRDRKLKKGDLVFVDIAFGLNGYHSDKTQVYIFGGKPTSEMKKVHQGCIDVQNRTAELLRPGAIPSEIYTLIMNRLDDQFKPNFMGFKDRQVKFLGHGVGLHVDEFPVIANGFRLPLVENMVISLEPKKGIENTGMVGVEDTYIVAPDGGKCITGGGRDILVV